MEEQFLNILKGRIRGEERAAFFKSLQDDPEVRKGYAEFERLWVINQMGFKLHNLGEKRRAFDSFWRKRSLAGAIRKKFSYYQAAAAVMAVVLVSGAIFFALGNRSIETLVLVAPKGNVSNIELGDGSSVWLNSESRIEMKRYRSSKVVVNLTGEAYFDVIHDSTREFIVKVGDYAIHDLGTQFNVAYDEQAGYVEVALFDGLVEFKEGIKRLYPGLQPGRMFCFDMNNQSFKEKSADKGLITAWKDGKFIFMNEKMENIVRELENWYDVRFVFENESIKEDEFFGVIKRRTSLEHILSVLKLSAEIDYSMQQQEDGSLLVVLK
ncbi:FecR family protein [Geofilum rhodophaeum]|uniref:FecR family protein n=1 Tax=Geofilum rhodophaeum TaxID=1965019 RepID=UPI000B521EA1|nr:FecR family protein [Geofilum rhodophaeum]